MTGPSRGRCYDTGMRHLVLAALAAALAACSTPESRIRKNRAAYESWPPEVQALVKQGRVDVGFTAEQVRVALGKPDRVYTRKTADSVQEVWSYGRGGGGSTSLGIGVGSGGGGASYGFGVGVGGPGYYPEDDRVRVVFESGRVASVEAREK